MRMELKKAFNLKADRHEYQLLVIDEAETCGHVVTFHEHATKEDLVLGLNSLIDGILGKVRNSAE